jgi:macrodomain Ter protein organizer (MatP/YcbG family)
LKPKDEVTRSLLIDRQVWDDAMKYSRQRYKMSLSKVIEALLEEWLTKEKRKPLDNSKQGKFFE